MTAEAAAETDVVAEAPAPASALLFATQEDWAQVQDAFDKLIDRFESLKVQLLPEGPLVWLARELPTANAINLLQGEFAPQENYGSQWRKWRVAAFLGIGLLGTHICADALSLHQAKKHSAELQTSIEQIFASSLPGEKPVDARRQMQARLSQIRGTGAGPEYFLRTLQSLSGAIAGRPKTSVDALSFRESTLDLKLTAPTVDDLAALSQSMQKQGLIAEIQSSTPSGNGIEGRVQIRGAAGTGAGK